MSFLVEVEKTTPRQRRFFAQGELGDAVAYQSFTFMVFIFYYTVIKLDVLWISAGFIIFSVWNACDDLLLGYLSDRTKSRWGRRVPWMATGIIPLCAVLILFYTPPNDSAITSFTYFVITLFVFDFFYTAFSLNYNSLWTEMFVSVKERSEVGRLRGIFVISGLIIAYLLPTLLITDLTNIHNLPATPGEYVLTGIVCAIIAAVSLSLTVKYGCKEPREFSRDAKTAPSFGQSLKFSFKNKAFVIFMIPALATWTVNGILPTVIPLFATHILGVTETDSIMTGVILLVAFLVGAVSMPLWTIVRKKYGARNTGIVASLLWAVTLIVFMFCSDLTSALIAMVFVGLGLGGSIYFYDQCIAEIIDADEVEHGTRRAGGYYGIISFIIRFSGVINFLAIGLVFTGADWSNYTPHPGVSVELGLRFLVGIFPAIILVLCAVAMYFYPLHGEALKKVREQLTVLHEQKRKDTEAR